MKPTPGQTYRLTGFDPESTVTICHVDESSIGTIYHVRLDGLRIPHPYAPGGVVSAISHMPFSESALLESLGSLITDQGEAEGWEEAYSEWKVAFELGEASIWELPVYDALQVHQSLILSSD